MTHVVTAAGVSVTTRGEAVDGAEAVLDRLVTDGVPAALTARSAQLWGPDAVADAERGLGWLDLPENAEPLLSRLAALVSEARAAGLDRVLLAGTGGSVTAARVIARTCAPAGTVSVLDGTDPHQVAGLLAQADLKRTLVVVSSKGASLEVDAHRRILAQAFRDAGIGDLDGRFLTVTDPGSPFGASVVPADPGISDRFGALTAYGLLPAALAGADPAVPLAEAAALVPALRQTYDNPALVLGAALGAAALAGRDKLVIAGHGSDLVDSAVRGGTTPHAPRRAFGADLSDWVEQLIAGSTGGDGKGILPVVVEGIEAPGSGYADDLRRVILGSRPDEPGPAREAGLNVAGPLGAQFLLWEYAVAVAARVIGVNPFGDPGGAEAEDITAALLRAEEGAAPTVVMGAPALVSGPVEVHGPEQLLKGARTLTAALDAIVSAIPERGHLAVTAYLDQLIQADAAGLRPLLAARTGQLRKSPAPVTFGWGPRSLHTLRPYHRGGPRHGVFLQITGSVEADLPVPGRPYTLGQLQLAQAFGDLRAMRMRGRPAVRVHLRDRAEGIAELLTALK